MLHKIKVWVSQGNNIKIKICQEMQDQNHQKKTDQYILAFQILTQ